MLSTVLCHENVIQSYIFHKQFTRGRQLKSHRMNLLCARNIAVTRIIEFRYQYLQADYDYKAKLPVLQKQVAHCCSML